MNKFSQSWTLLIILIISLVLGLFGIFLENNFSVWISTLLFAILSSTYFIFAYYSNFKNKGLENNV